MGRSTPSHWWPLCTKWGEELRKSGNRESGKAKTGTLLAESYHGRPRPQQRQDETRIFTKEHEFMWVELNITARKTERILQKSSLAPECEFDFGLKNQVFELSRRWDRTIPRVRTSRKAGVGARKANLAR